MEFLYKLCELTISQMMFNIDDITLKQVSEQMSVEAVEGDMQALLTADTIEARRFDLLCKFCGDSELGKLTMMLAISELLNPKIGNVLKEYGGVTIESAQRLLAGDIDETDCILDSMRSGYNQLKNVLYCKRSTAPFFRHPFSADERIISYICGEERIDMRLTDAGIYLQHATDVKDSLYVRHEYVEIIATAVKKGGIIQLSGEHGVGKKLLLKHGCSVAELGMLFVDAGDLLSRTPQEANRMIELIKRELILFHCDVCFYYIDKLLCPDEAGYKRFIRTCLLPLEGYNIVICTALEIELIAMLDSYVEHIVLPNLTREEQLCIWKGCCKQKEINLPDLTYISGSFKLNATQIQKAVERLSRLSAKEYDKKAIGDACTAVLPPPSRGGIQKIKVSYTIDDLMLPAEQKRNLLSICAHVNHRHLVYDSWQMEKKYAYGKNVSALFVGAPGTGKTMAVHVLSNMLNIPLYRIDLSQVVDKYIGETEKRLEEIFNIAEKCNTILFFDEADAIFGKRSEVNDSKDKYANTEVSYILQRIEQYDGIVILASNYKKNIDEAFMRRMRYLVEFNMPNAITRRQIWENGFTDEIPCVKIDFDYLARQFELSGGAIKNIILNAAFLAAESGDPVNMYMICESIRGENLKMGKTMIKKDFGEYDFTGYTL